MLGLERNSHQGRIYFTDGKQIINDTLSHRINYFKICSITSKKNELTLFNCRRQVYASVGPTYMVGHFNHFNGFRRSPTCHSRISSPVFYVSQIWTDHWRGRAELFLNFVLSIGSKLNLQLINIYSNGIKTEE